MINDEKNYLKPKLKKLLAEKITENLTLPRKLTSYEINPEVMDTFFEVTHASGLITRRQGVNRVIEAFMMICNELYAEDAKQVNLFYQPTINHNVVNKTVNITERIEVKLVKEELESILRGFQKKDAPATYANSLSKRLKNTLPKAIRVQGKVQDPELEKLLLQCEQHLK
ncbi:MAG: hypothetical protein ABSE15_05060 [Candidatus Bathyarchaeia archaeon]|jgi:hypothetical protein